MCASISLSQVTHFNNVMIERPEKARIPCFLGRGPNKRKVLETLVERTEISINSSHIGTSCTISPQIWWLVGPGGISRQGRRHRRPFVAAQAVPTRFCSAKMVSARARDLHGARDARCGDGVSSRARFSGDDRRGEEKPFVREARSRCGSRRASGGTSSTRECRRDAPRRQCDVSTDDAGVCGAHGGIDASAERVPARSPAPLARMSRRVSVRFRVGSGARIGATRRYHRSFSAAVDITPSRLMFLRRRRARR